MTEPGLPAESVLNLDDRPSPPPPARRFGPSVLFIALLAIGVLVAIALWVVPKVATPPGPATERPQSEAPAPQAPGQAQVDAVPLPNIRHPLPVLPFDPDLPALGQSDPSFRDTLLATLGSSDLAGWLVPQDLIRHIVATVDNLPRTTALARVSPLKPVPGSFVTSGSGNEIVIAAENARRYEPLVRALEAVDAERVVALYFRWYPRFQEAYRELGYPDGHFNDRLVEAIDTLLAAPEPKAALAVVQPKVLWRFADPALEALPSGQKIMLRIGPENAARAKARLLAFRRLVATGSPR